jgi:hypothetical protein
VHTQAVKPAFGAELELQAVHTLVCVPAAEKVPVPQLATLASAVEVQAVVTRWPGPAVEQAVQVGFALAPV